MGRSRSRSTSPRRRYDRERIRDKERERERDRRRRRSRERERRRSPAERHRHHSSPRRSRSRSRDKATGRLEDFQRKKQNSNTVFIQQRPVIAEIELQGKTDEEKEMMRTMGFGGFDSSKGKKVNGNTRGDVHVILKRKYRQYMNRKGGFNRPLDFVA